MLYVLILLLAVAILVQWRRTDALARRVALLEQQVRALASEREPLVLTAPVPDEELLLDTPLPEAANDRAAPKFYPQANAYGAWIWGLAIGALWAGFAFGFAANALGPAMIALGGAALTSAAPLLVSSLKTPPMSASLVLCVCAVLMLWTWPAALLESRSLAAPAALGALLAGIATAGVAARKLAAASFTVVAAAIVLGAAAAMRIAGADPGPAVLFAPVALAAALACAALLATPNHRDRNTLAAAGAISAAALISMTTSALWGASSAPLLSFAASALLGAAAWRASRTAPSTLQWWCGGASALLLLAVHAAAPAQWLPVALAASALLLAWAHARTDWPALDLAALVAGGFALIHAALAPAEVILIAPPAGTLLSLAAAMLLLFAAWRALGDEGEPAIAEAMRACALLAAIVLVAHAIGLIGRFSDFTQTALQALVLLCAGHIAAPRRAATAGAISQALGPILIGAGLAWLLWRCGWALNPWWGRPPARIAGPAIFNPQLIAFAVPALAAFISAGRWSTRAPAFASACLGAGVAASALWITLEIRRAFHGADMHGSPTTGPETLLYLTLAAGALFALRTQDRRARFQDGVHTLYERLFGVTPSLETVAGIQPLLTTPGQRRPRRRR